MSRPAKCDQKSKSLKVPLNACAAVLGSGCQVCLSSVNVTFARPMHSSYFGNLWKVAGCPAVAPSWKNIKCSCFGRLVVQTVGKKNMLAGSCSLKNLEPLVPFCSFCLASEI